MTTGWQPRVVRLRKAFQEHLHHRDERGRFATKTILGGSKLHGPGGSNPGGVYRGADGVTRYVKFYADPAQAAGEHLANQLYLDLGHDAPESGVFPHEGKLAYASIMREGYRTLGEVGLTPERARAVLDGFLADVLTANWDAVGLVHDNVLFHEKFPGRPLRVDNGGTFLMRAQAGRKPTGVLHQITEWKNFAPGGLNPSYARIFTAAKLRPADLIERLRPGLQLVRRVRDQAGGWRAYVAAKVPDLNPTDAATITSMLETRTRLLGELFGDVEKSWWSLVTKAIRRYPKGAPQGKGGQFAPGGPKTTYGTGAEATLVWHAGQGAGPTLHGIPFTRWTPPDTLEGWQQVPGQLPTLHETPLVVPQGRHASAGAIIEEPDGRVWVVSPRNQFGGYRNTFPKGTQEDGLTLQQTAIKETYEESGLQIQITGHYGDFEKSTSVVRFYRAKRIGGTPTDHGWETEAVKLVPKSALGKVLNRHSDHLVAVQLGVKPAQPPVSQALGTEQHRWNWWARLIQKATGFDEAEHPRHPAGTAQGGQFKPKNDAFYTKFHQIVSTLPPYMKGVLLKLADAPSQEALEVVWETYVDPELYKLSTDTRKSLLQFYDELWVSKPETSPAGSAPYDEADFENPPNAIQPAPTGIYPASTGIGSGIPSDGSPIAAFPTQPALAPSNKTEAHKFEKVTAILDKWGQTDPALALAKINEITVPQGSPKQFQAYMANVKTALWKHDQAKKQYALAQQEAAEQAAAAAKLAALPKPPVLPAWHKGSQKKADKIKAVLESNLSDTEKLSQLNAIKIAKTTAASVAAYHEAALQSIDQAKVLTQAPIAYAKSEEGGAVGKAVDKTHAATVALLQQHLPKPPAPNTSGKYSPEQIKIFQDKVQGLYNAALSPNPFHTIDAVPAGSSAVQAYKSQLLEALTKYLPEEPLEPGSFHGKWLAVGQHTQTTWAPGEVGTVEEFREAAWAKAKGYLDLQEIDAITNYTGSGSGAANAFRQDLNLPLTKYHERLDKAFGRKTSVFLKSGYVVRKMDHAPGLDTLAKAKKAVGMEFIDPGYFGGTTGRQPGPYAYSAKVFVHTYIPPGTAGLIVQPISNHKSENEVLLARNTRFRIVAVSDTPLGKSHNTKDNSDKRVHIYVEVLPREQQIYAPLEEHGFKATIPEVWKAKKKG